MSGIERGYLPPLDGHRVAWQRCGPRGGPAMVLPHGGPGAGLSASLMARCAAAGWDMIGLDQRGCGASLPHAGRDVAALEANTTCTLIGDIERLRVALGVERWCVFGGSWGATLAQAYALAHPVGVSGLLLAGVTMTGPGEIDWLYGHVGHLLPEAFAAFRRRCGQHGGYGRTLVTAYRRRLMAEAPAVYQRAADAWCAWEEAVASVDPRSVRSTRWDDPVWRLGFARLVTHYFSAGGWLVPGMLLARASEHGRVPVELVHGRFDLAAPLATAVALHGAIPGSRLQIVEGGLHGVAEPAMAAAVDQALGALRQAVTKKT